MRIKEQRKQRGECLRCGLSERMTPRFCLSCADKERAYHARPEIRAKKKAYREKNKEQLKAKKKEYVERNRKQITAYMHEYFVKNRERLNKKAREYRAANRDRVNAHRRAYRLQNRDSISLKIRLWLYRTGRAKPRSPRQTREQINQRRRDWALRTGRVKPRRPAMSQEERNQRVREWKYRTGRARPRMVRVKQQITPLAEFYPYVMAESLRGSDLLKLINDTVPKNLPEYVRADVCQDLALAVLTGEVSESQIPDEVKKYMKMNFQMTARFGCLSLDDPNMRNIIEFAMLRGRHG